MFGRGALCRREVLVLKGKGRASSNNGDERERDSGVGFEFGYERPSAGQWPCLASGDISKGLQEKD